MATKPAVYCGAVAASQAAHGLMANGRLQAAAWAASQNVQKTPFFPPETLALALALRPFSRSSLMGRMEGFVCLAGADLLAPATRASERRHRRRQQVTPFCAANLGRASRQRSGRNSPAAMQMTTKTGVAGEWRPSQAHQKLSLVQRPTDRPLVGWPVNSWSARVHDLGRIGGRVSWPPSL